MMVADIVRAPLEDRDRDWNPKRVAQQRDIALVELILERLGARRNDHLAAIEQCRNEISKRFPGARAGFGDELAPRLDGPCDGLGHCELLPAEAEAGQRSRQNAAVAKDRFER